MGNPARSGRGDGAIDLGLEAGACWLRAPAVDRRGAAAFAEAGAGWRRTGTASRRGADIRGAILLQGDFSVMADGAGGREAEHSAGSRPGQQCRPCWAASRLTWRPRSTASSTSTPARWWPPAAPLPALAASGCIVNVTSISARSGAARIGPLQWRQAFVSTFTRATNGGRALSASVKSATSGAVKAAGPLLAPDRDVDRRQFRQARFRPQDPHARQHGGAPQHGHPRARP